MIYPLLLGLGHRYLAALLADQIATLGIYRW